jgi:hypothetical protein
MWKEIILLERDYRGYTLFTPVCKISQSRRIQDTQKPQNQKKFPLAFLENQEYNKTRAPSRRGHALLGEATPEVVAAGLGSGPIGKNPEG